MKAVIRYLDRTKGFECKEVPKPIASPGYVIIKVYACPINPSDEGFTKGNYPIAIPKNLEYVCCGFEGAGQVVEIGAEVPESYKGKRVTFTSFKADPNYFFGTWCEYAKVHYTSCAIFDDSVPYEEACEVFTNPLTVFGMIEQVKKANLNAFVHTAAASSLGKMLLLECMDQKIDVICVVRKKEQEDILKKLGAKYILNSSLPTFENDLKELSLLLNATICFDAVGGSLTSKLLSGIPQNSTIYIYGALGGNINDINIRTMLNNKIKLKGYNVTMSDFVKDPKQRKEKVLEIVNDFTKKGKFKTHVACRFTLEKCKEALDFYKLTGSSGKVIFIPSYHA